MKIITNIIILIFEDTKIKIRGDQHKTKPYYILKISNNFHRRPFFLYHINLTNHLLYSKFPKTTKDFFLFLIERQALIQNECISNRKEVQK